MVNLILPFYLPLWLALSGPLFANPEPEAQEKIGAEVHEKKGKEIIPKLIPHLAEPTTSEIVIEQEPHEDHAVVPKKKIKKRKAIATKKEEEVKPTPVAPAPAPVVEVPVSAPAPVATEPAPAPIPVVEAPVVNPETAPAAPVLLPIEPKPETTIQPLQAEVPKPNSEDPPTTESKEESEVAIIFYRNRFFPSRLRVREGKAIRFMVANLNAKPAAFFIESLHIQRWIAGHTGRDIASEIPKEILESKNPKPGYVEINTTLAKGEYLYHDPVSGAYGILEVD